MASNLACVGLDVANPGELSRLVERAGADARPAGTFDGVRVVRWQDPSGAALVLGLRGGDAADLLPTYASTAGGLLANCRLVNKSVATAAVVDTGGQQQTTLTFEAEQYRQLKELDHPVAGPARITALGFSVQVYADADVYAASAGSLVDPDANPDEEPPPDFADAEHPVTPEPGNIISGTVYLTAAISDEGMASKHRQF